MREPLADVDAEALLTEGLTFDLVPMTRHEATSMFTTRILARHHCFERELRAPNEMGIA